jgi:uncharacterized protein (TIGR03118 family)
MCRDNSARGVPVLCALLLLAVFPQRATAGSTFVQINLVPDAMGRADNYDPNLKKPWGIAFAVNSLDFEPSIGHRYAYDGAGNTIPLVVGIPPVGFPTGPTGQLFNSNSSFNLPDGSPAHFLFDTLDGRILGWNGARHGGYGCDRGRRRVHGARDRRSGGANYIYAADNTGHITVFDSSFNNVTGTTFAGKFVDPNAVTGFHPFNIQNIGGNLYVTYAAVNAQGVGWPGGFVDEFNSSGAFLGRIATGGSLNAP